MLGALVLRIEACAEPFWDNGEVAVVFGSQRHLRCSLKAVDFITKKFFKIISTSLGNREMGKLGVKCNKQKVLPQNLMQHRK